MLDTAKTITVKQIKRLLKKSPDPELRKLIQGLSDHHIFRLVDPEKYVAATMWCPEDIEESFEMQFSDVPNKFLHALPAYQKKAEICQSLITSASFQDSLSESGTADYSGWDVIYHALNSALNDLYPDHTSEKVLLHGYTDRIERFLWPATYDTMTWEINGTPLPICKDLHWMMEIPNNDKLIPVYLANETEENTVFPKQFAWYVDPTFAPTTGKQSYQIYFTNDQTKDLVFQHRKETYVKNMAKRYLQYAGNYIWKDKTEKPYTGGFIICKEPDGSETVLNKFDFTSETEGE